MLSAIINISFVFSYVLRIQRRRIDLPAPIHLNKHRVSRDFDILILLRGITVISNRSRGRIPAASEYGFLHAAVLALIFKTSHFPGYCRLVEVRPDGLVAETIFFVL